MLRRPTAACLAALFTAALGGACDKGLEPEPVCARGLVGVCGTLQFRGAIPDSTNNVYVVAYATFPQSCSDLFQFAPFPPVAVPYTDTMTRYSLSLSPGAYAWVLAVWRKDGPFTGTTADTAVLREVGHYRDPADTTRPGVVTVPAGMPVGDVDFIVNFDSLRPVSSYFPCAAR